MSSPSVGIKETEQVEQLSHVVVERSTWRRRRNEGKFSFEGNGGGERVSKGAYQSREPSDDSLGS